MIDQIKIFLIIILIIYSIFITLIFIYERRTRDSYLKYKVNYINSKQIELSKRENNVVDKEKCMSELGKVQNLNKAAAELLTGYKSVVN